MRRVSETCLFFALKRHTLHKIFHILRVVPRRSEEASPSFMRHSAYRKPCLPGASFAIFSRPVNDPFHCRLISVFEKHHTFRIRKGNNGRSSAPKEGENRGVCAFIFVVFIYSWYCNCEVVPFQGYTMA